jgi:hypothetical protein
MAITIVMACRKTSIEERFKSNMAAQNPLHSLLPHSLELPRLCLWGFFCTCYCRWCGLCLFIIKNGMQLIIFSSKCQPHQIVRCDTHKLRLCHHTAFFSADDSIHISDRKWLRHFNWENTFSMLTSCCSWWWIGDSSSNFGYKSEGSFHAWLDELSLR